MLPLIGAALGVVSTLSSIGGQRNQARAQRDQLQAQADEVATQRALTTQSIQNQERLARVNLQYELLGQQAQRTLGLIQNDVRTNQAALERTSQRMALDAQQSQAIQEFAQREANTLQETNAGFAQLQQEAQQQGQVSDQLRQQSGQAQAANTGATQAGGDTTQLMANLLQQGEVEQALALIQDQGTQSLLRERAYELGILDLGEAGTLAAIEGGREQVDRGEQLDTASARATAEDIEAQVLRNNIGITGADEAQRLGLMQARTTSDVQNTTQQRMLDIQGRNVNGPGFWGVAQALGNAALTAYQGYNAYQAGRPPTPPPSDRLSIGGNQAFAALGLVPGVGDRATVAGPVGGNPAYLTRGLVPTTGTPTPRLGVGSLTGRIQY